MRLTFNEALMFVRAGDDMRREAWPAGSFVRWIIGEPPDLPGFDKQPYAAGLDDTQAQDWRRA
jgi:hypothetical protein